MDIRVGVLHDYARPDRGASFEWAARLGIGEVEASGRLPAPVIFMHEPAHEDIGAAFVRLADRGVLAILRPAITDGGLAVRRLADEESIQCYHYAGNDQSRKSWQVRFQYSSIYDDTATH